VSRVVQLVAYINVTLNVTGFEFSHNRTRAVLYLQFKVGEGCTLDNASFLLNQRLFSQKGLVVVHDIGVTDQEPL